MFTKENTNTIKKVLLSLISITTLTSLCACQSQQEETLKPENHETNQNETDTPQEDTTSEETVQKTVEIVEKWFSTQDTKDYTEESYQKYKDALNQLKDKVQTSNVSTIIIVNDAISQLEKTQEAQLRQVKEELKSIVEQVHKLNLNDYKSESVQALQEKLAQVQNLLDKNNETLEQYKLAQQSLLQTIEQLEIKQQQNNQLLDAKNMLLAVINKASLLDRNLYTQTTYHTLETVLKESSEIVKSDNLKSINQAREKLENAIKNLVTLEDEQYQKVLQELQKALEYAKTFLPSTYTKDSFDKLQEAIRLAEKVYNESQNVQAWQDAIKSLEEAVENLEVDDSELHNMKEQLSQIVNNIKRRDWSGYTQKSVEMLNEKVLEAEIVVSHETNLQVISDMIELLNQIEYKMVLRGDVSELENILAHVETMNMDDYTEESQGVLNIGVERARIILTDKNAIQDEVDKMCNELNQIISNLQTKVDVEKDSLRTVVYHAESLNLEEYIHNSQSTLKNVLEKAKGLLEEKEVTVDEVKKMITEVKDTVDSMIKLGSTIELEDLIKNVQTLDKELYTQDSYQVVKEKRDDAVQLISNPNRTQEMVSEAIKALQEAIDKLEKVDISLPIKQKLLETIDNAEQIDSYDYTKDSFLNLQNAISQAKEMITNEDVSSYENAIKGIEEAINALVKKGNIARLRALMNTANDIDFTQYKEDGVKQLQQVLEKANTIVENGANQTTIDEVADALNEALKALEKISNEQVGTYNKEYAKQVFELVNQERQNAGLTALEWDNNLEVGADIRGEEISKLFEHTRPDGSKFSTAIADKGNFRMFGENIARLYGSPESVMRGWMNSTGHKNNILNAGYTHMAVSCYKDSYGNLCWVQIFAG